MSVPWCRPIYQPEAMTRGSLPQARALARLRAIGGEQVAGAANRTNHRRPGRVRLDLLADAGDAHIDGAVEGLAVACLGEVEEPLAREDALGVLGKGLEQGEFGAGERVLVA